MKDKLHFWFSLDLRCLALRAVLTERLVCNIPNSIVLQPKSFADFADRKKKKEHGRLSRGRDDDDGNNELILISEGGRRALYNRALIDDMPLNRILRA